MNLSKENFFAVGRRSGLSQQILDSFRNELIVMEGAPANSAFVTYLYYLGALIVIAAMTFFMGLAWESFGGFGIFLIATIYALIFLKWGSASWNKPGMRVPAGLSITMAVSMVPLAIYGIERFTDLWPSDDRPEKYADLYRWVRSQWVFMEFGTIVAGLIALRYFRFPFLTAPIAFCAWYLSMDIAPLIFGRDASFHLNAWVTLVFGLMMLTFGLVVDRLAQQDYGFWLYLFGAFAFWGALGGLMLDGTEVPMFVYMLINVLMMILAIVLRRNILMVLGGIGLFVYLTHLAADIFQDSILFPFALSAIGMGFIYLGICYQRNQVQIESKLLSWMPNFLKRRRHVP